MVKQVGFEFFWLLYERYIVLSVLAQLFFPHFKLILLFVHQVSVKVVFRPKAILNTPSLTQYTPVYGLRRFFPGLWLHSALCGGVNKILPTENNTSGWERLPFEIIAIYSCYLIRHIAGPGRLAGLNILCPAYPGRLAWIHPTLLWALMGDGRKKFSKWK